MAVKTLQQLKSDLLQLIRTGGADTSAAEVRTMFTNVLDTMFDKFSSIKKIFLNGVLQTPDADGNLNLEVTVDTSNLATKQEVTDGLALKVDKVAGKQLSTEDFTTAEKQKLAGLEAPHYKGTYPSLEALQAAHPAGVPGDEAQVDVAGADVVVYIWDHTDSKWVQQQGATTGETAASIKTKYESNPDTNAFTDSQKARLALTVTAVKQGTTTYSPDVTGQVTLPEQTASGKLYNARGQEIDGGATNKLLDDELKKREKERNFILRFDTLDRSVNIGYTAKCQVVSATPVRNVSSVSFQLLPTVSAQPAATSSIATLNSQIAALGASEYYEIEVKVPSVSGSGRGSVEFKSNLL